MKDLYNEWVMLHNFFYDNEPIKNWINEENFNNNFKDDWESLMEFVEKIENIKNEEGSSLFNIIIEQCFVEIIINQSSETIVNIDGDNKIDAIYKSILEFVKWNNLNNK
ncbi:hypothetical protein [Wenyingzhuangia sp. 2_MG-2023]|uniref:hypothetical protein n=1 Tax=Wenyingzhuangia sp. 2_MG-2023 TaxID=3062639 RepID=UPI0026E25972|nr:hypothetical protein [Wenyingzhuangia sp. 2_MG-2023]MDO6737056.1 hypothetical protein [Wenyingzhuangia sp. 2_MG-2023]